MISPSVILRRFLALLRSLREFVEHISAKQAEFWSGRPRQEALPSKPPPPREDLSASSMVAFESRDLDPTVLADRSGGRERLMRALAQLPEEHAAPLRLLLLEDLSMKEVAKRLSLPSADAARKRVQRAHDAVRKILEGDEGW